MKAKFLFIILVCSVSQLGAQLNTQELIGRKSIYFESGRYELSEDSRKLLDIMCDSFKSFKSYRIIIRGNTDDVGDSLFNIRLSEKRVNETRKYFNKKGIPQSAYTVSFLGENKPLASNATDQGKQKNRRVDIFYKYVRKTDSIIKLPSIRELYRKLERPGQKFCINPLRDTTIRGEHGTLVYIKADAFKLSNTCKKACLNIVLKEAFIPSEMIIDDLTTISEDSGILKSNGMVFIEAKDCKGKTVNTRKGKQMVLMTPTKSLLKHHNNLYGGWRRDNDSMMEWEWLESNYISVFSEADLLYCIRMLCGVEGPFDCDCRFLFCRVKRLDNVIKGWFSRCTRCENKIFRKELKICRLEKQNEKQGGEDMLSKTELRDAEIQDLRKEIIAIHSRFPDCGNGGPHGFYRCYEWRERLESAGIDNIEAFLKVLHGRLLDSFGITTLTALDDTLHKISSSKVRAKRKILMERYGVNTEETLDDTLTKLNIALPDAYYESIFKSVSQLKYTMFNTSYSSVWHQLGNRAILNTPVASIKTDLKAASNIDCKMIIQGKHIIPAKQVADSLVFTDISVNEHAWIVVLKYMDGKAFLYLEEIITGNQMIRVDFKEYSIEELREKLKILNE